MAISLKVDTEDFPGIISMLGLGGNNALPPAHAEAAPDPSAPPPVDPSLGGADNPTAQPSIDPGQGEVLPPEKNKLQSLREFLDPQPPAPQNYVMAPPGEAVPPPPPPVASRNVSTLPDLGSGVPQVADKKTFAQRHPVGSTFLRVAMNAGEGGLIGSQFANAGQGFEAAKQATDPIRKKMEDAVLAEKQAATAHQQATTDQLKSQVTINGVTMPFALALKYYPQQMKEMGLDKRNQANIDSRESIAGDKNAIALRAKGLKANPAGGAPVPLTRDEMSEIEQSHLDLTQSQQDEAAAKAELDRNKNNPNSPAYKAAMGRLQVAQKNAETAAGRLGLGRDTFNANYFGTGPNGQALPGATTDEKTGLPVGPRMANAAKVPADRLKRGDLASNAIGNLNDIVDLIHKNPELFGSLSGRITTAREMMGSDEPAIREIAIAAHNYALASAGVHGTRSQGAVEKTENELLNHWKDGDTAVLGGIAQAKKSLQTFVDNQKAGNRPIPSPTQSAPVNASAEVYAADGKTLIGHAVNGKYVPLGK